MRGKERGGGMVKRTRKGKGGEADREREKRGEIWRKEE